MSSALSVVPLFFSQLLSQLPVLVVCIVGLVLLAGRRAADPKAITWAMAGFGVSAGLAVFIPLLYGLLNFARMQGAAMASITWIYPVVGFVSSLLHAATYGLFLLAFLRFCRAPRA